MIRNNKKKKMPDSILVDPTKCLCVSDFELVTIKRLIKYFM